jgi:hypothetical protein
MADVSDSDEIFAFDGDAGEVRPVTGFTYGGSDHRIELYTDDDQEEAENEPEATGGREQEYDIMDSQELSYTIVSELVATYGFAGDPEAWQANAAIKKAIYAATAPLLAELTRVSAERKQLGMQLMLTTQTKRAVESDFARVKQAGKELMCSAALLMACVLGGESIEDPTKAAIEKVFADWRDALAGAVAAQPEPPEGK